MAPCMVCCAMVCGGFNVFIHNVIILSDLMFVSQVESDLALVVGGLGPCAHGPLLWVLLR